MNALVLTLSFGSGHVRASQAVAKEIACQVPAARVRVIDVLQESHSVFRLGYEVPYWLMLRYVPSLWNRLISARRTQMHESTAPRWAFEVGCRRVFRTIESFQPDVIVAVEVAACEISAIARQKGITRAPVIAVITDYEAEPIWVKREVDAFTVADEQGADELVRWGAPAQKIFVCGIPIDSSFSIKHEAKAVRFRYRLNDDVPLVLLMGGGMGPSRMDQVVGELNRVQAPLHMIAIAGHDRRAGRRLERLRVEVPASLQVLGWTDDVPALMQASDLLVTKPGGLTTLEAAASSLPVVLFDPIPGPEFINAKRMVEAGAAVVTRGAQDTARAALSLLLDRARRDAMAAKARSLARPNARREIAALALQLAESKSEVSTQLRRPRRVA